MTTEFHRVATCHLILISSFLALPISSLPHFFLLCLSGNSAQGGKFRMTFQPEGLICKPQEISLQCKGCFVESPSVSRQISAERAGWCICKQELLYKRRPLCNQTETCLSLIEAVQKEDKSDNKLWQYLGHGRTWHELKSTQRRFNYTSSQAGALPRLQILGGTKLDSVQVPLH